MNLPNQAGKSSGKIIEAILRFSVPFYHYLPEGYYCELQSSAKTRAAELSPAKPAPLGEPGAMARPGAGCLEAEGRPGSDKAGEGQDPGLGPADCSFTPETTGIISSLSLPASGV